MVKLFEIIGKPITGEWGKNDDVGNGIPVLRTTNFTNEGHINYSKVITRKINTSKIKNKLLRTGDIIIEKSGGGPDQPVGRVVYFEGEPNKYLSNNFTSILRITDKATCNAKYLFYQLWWYHKTGKTNSYQNKTTGISNLKLDKYVRELDIRLPSILSQNMIVKTLDSVLELLALRKQQLAELDNLIKSTFYDMFGDPGENPYNWNTVLLGNVADIVSGITKGRKTAEANLVEVPYLRVANVQDGHLNLSEIKLIEATDSEIKKYQLYNGDLLMTEGGDPDKLGRCAIWRGEIPISIHQNHIFRVRLIGEVVLPEYASFLIGSSYGKRYFLKAAKQTTGIATINSTQLKNFPMLVPNIDIQYKLKNIVTKMDEQKFLVQKAIDETQHLFDSLMSEYFD